MKTLGTLCALLPLLLSVRADVVEHFEDQSECVKYFYKEKVPEWGASTPGVARLCQRFVNRYHFATLYDTNHRIAVYSVFHVDYPGVYLGEKQALNEDFTYSGFDRGHLNPNGHHAVPSRNATFTLTNVVPQNPKLNQNSWRIHESDLTNLFKAKCSKAFVLVGAIPSAENWIVKNNVKRVNIPDYLWNAYCCVDNNDKPIQSGAATARNTEDNRVEKLSLAELGEFLQQFSNEPVGELFYNSCSA
uniref:Si:dkey-243k1.3 n=1 Tax=Acanthochromis polyacanthus TaxID=80966 RepID=A0A3Q1EN86_9TELE